MLINYAAMTHQGRVRKNNEDGFLVSALDGEEPMVNALGRAKKKCPAGLLAAVADGMGGAAAGEIASREGLASLSVNLFSRWGCLDETHHQEPVLWRALKNATESASESVLRYSDQEKNARGMGSTLTACVVWSGAVYTAQVGDSRAYLFRDGQLYPLTQDQTLVNEMIASGMLTRTQAKSHPQRSMITQALGAPTPIKVALTKAVVRRGDRLLLCSDGLHGEIPDVALAQILARHLSPRETLRFLLETALESGGKDNISAVLLTLDDPGLPLAKHGERVQVTEPNPKDLDQPKSGLFNRIGIRRTGKT